MKKHRQIERDGLIVTHFSGLHTYADAVDALDELLVMMKGKKHIYELLITDENIELSFSGSEEAHLKDKVKSTFMHFEFGALAVVASRDLVFGLSRMLEINIQNERFAIAVLRTEELARKWIQEIRAMHNKSLEKDAS